MAVRAVAGDVFVDAAAGAAIGLPGRGWSDGGGAQVSAPPGTPEFVEQRIAQLRVLTGKDAPAAPGWVISPGGGGGVFGGSYSGSEFGG